MFDVIMKTLFVMLESKCAVSYMMTVNILTLLFAFTMLAGLE